jgi:hypothetical protein
VNPAIIRPAAAAEIDEAYLWYESRRSGLGEEFLADVKQTLDRICERRSTERAVGVSYEAHGIGRRDMKIKKLLD